jgi:phage-related protein
MSSIVKAFSDLLGSVFEVFTSIIHTIFSFIQSIFSMAGSLLNKFAQLFGGTVNFLFCMFLFLARLFRKVLIFGAANIFIIGTLVAVFFAYILYTQRQAKPIGAKKSA